MTPYRIVGLGLLMVLLASAASSASTPLPGGANQLGAVSGKVGQTLWNGVLRFKVVEVRDATAADHPESVVPLASQKVMVITAIIRNGTPRTWGELVGYALADKDDVSFDVPMHFFTPPTLTIEQGASARQTALVPVDKSFVPVKLIFTCGSCAKGSFKPFRVTLPQP